ncbi:hypothetical protein Tco_1467737 [Tanacetum coccineum]
MEALIADEDAMDKEVKDRPPSAGSNQGKSAKRRRHDSGTSGSAQPPTKDDEQSSKKPRESDASASKQHPALTSTGSQITDTRYASDEGHVSDLEDTDNVHIPKVSTTMCFKPIPDGERPATPEPEWTIRLNDFPEPENNWANTCHNVSSSRGEQASKEDINLERPNWDAADYYFKEDYTIVPKPRAVVYRDRNDQRKLMRLNELHKFSDGTLTRVMEKLDHMVKDFHLFEYNKGMETRKWLEDDKRRSKDCHTL